MFKDDDMNVMIRSELAWFLGFALSPFLVVIPFYDELVERVCTGRQFWFWPWKILWSELTLPLLFTFRSIDATLFFSFGIISVSLLPFGIGCTVILLSGGKKVLRLGWNNLIMTCSGLPESSWCPTERLGVPDDDRSPVYLPLPALSGLFPSQAVLSL
jgi:hypothetical protein